MTALPPIAQLWQDHGADLVLAGLALGVFLVVLGLFLPQGDRTRILRRLSGRRAPARQGARGALLRDLSAAPSGMLAVVVPTDARERDEVALHLAQAGFAGRGAVIGYFLLRTVLGLALPLGFGALFLLDLEIGLAAEGGRLFDGLAPRQALQIGVAGVLLGFYGPARVVAARVAARRARIRRAFPNALDLIKVAIEAGMGFDAAMTRVAQEMQTGAPELAQEMLEAQREILAGRDRTAAYIDMAARLGIDEARSFAALIVQARQFGTSAAQALAIYSEDMRQRRELAAQEKANRLPVQMSAVMAVIMLPALIIVTVGPAILRYLDFVAG